MSQASHHVAPLSKTLADYGLETRFGRLVDIYTGRVFGPVGELEQVKALLDKEAATAVVQ